MNGPGERFVLWVQGCPLRCPGCWNQGMWDGEGGQEADPGVLAERIVSTSDIEGLTLTGGEPFAQAEGLVELAERVRARGLSVMVFTGFELDELEGAGQKRLLGLTDVLVSGRYVEARRAEGQGWIGSANQEIHFLTDRYSAADMPEGTECEVHISADGEVSVTGFPGRTGLGGLPGRIE